MMSVKTPLHDGLETYNPELGTLFPFMKFFSAKAYPAEDPLSICIRHEMTSYATFFVDVWSISSSYYAENP